MVAVEINDGNFFQDTRIKITYCDHLAVICADRHRSIPSWTGYGPPSLSPVQPWKDDSGPRARCPMHKAYENSDARRLVGTGRRSRFFSSR